VKGAMVYPSVIMTVAAAAIAILLIFVIPTFQEMFASVNMELPLPTRIVIGASSFLIHWWWACIAGAVGAGFMLRQYSKTPDGRKRIDQFMLNAPILGDVLRKSAVSASPGRSAP
jgi:type IV pilus assembly protein PilC